MLSLITTIESTGDLTATSLVSGEPIEGEVYIERIKGGVLGDGANSAIAGTFNTFPNKTGGLTALILNIVIPCYFAYPAGRSDLDRARICRREMFPALLDADDHDAGRRETGG